MTVVHGKNDFAEGSKILLDTDLKIILDHRNNFVGILKISNTAKNFASLANLSVLHHYFDKSTKFIFWSVSNKHEFFNKTILSAYIKELRVTSHCPEWKRIFNALLLRSLFLSLSKLKENNRTLI